MVKPGTELTDGAGPVLRRAPFSDNPAVGARGQRTQQRILDAAVEVFGERGYHRCGIDPITKRAGCSRVSFYQYFSSKEEVFQQLSGQVALQLAASTDALGTISAGSDGLAEIAAWVGRHSAIYRRYEPVFTVFPEASEEDAVVAVGSARWSRRSLARLAAKVEGAEIPTASLEPTLHLLQSVVFRLQGMARILWHDSPPEGTVEALERAASEVIHRALFGLEPGVNSGESPVVAGIRPESGRIPATEQGSKDPSGLSDSGRLTHDRLLAAGRVVFVERGYHRSRVDDVVEAAGLSHGAFYRYFDDKEALARPLVAAAMDALRIVFLQIPPIEDDGVPQRGALRRWLRSYNAAQVHEAAMLRVWLDAAFQDAALRSSAAPALDWGRSRMAEFLSPRGFGDVEADAAVLIALLIAFAAVPRDAAEVDAAASIIERGLLGAPG